MIKLSDYETQDALPIQMRIPERISLSYAFDRQKKKFLENMKRVYIWADLDQVDDGKLDFLAVENRVLFYSTAMESDVKRRLIQNSIYWYIKLGTRKAMEEMISIICGNENVLVEEWYTYGGEPFHFKVIVNVKGKGVEIDVNKLIKKINMYKRSIARLDSVNIGKIKRIDLYTSPRKEVFIKSEIGVNPYCKTLNKKVKMHMNFGNLRYIKLSYNKDRG